MSNKVVRAQAPVSFHAPENWAQRGQVSCPSTEQFTSTRIRNPSPASLLPATNTFEMTNTKRQGEQGHQCIVGAQ